MIMPAVISGWLLAFTLSLDDLVIASFVSGPGATTLPMLVFSSVRMGVNPEINALASLILGVVGIVGLIAWYLMGARQKNNGCAISSVQDADNPLKIDTDMQSMPRTFAASFSWKASHWNCLLELVGRMPV
ncbi:putrescine transporter subunit: membrane component of ABC superfamily [Kluyvera cryocrescens]|uniref:Putrescine transporter subunit: membrane component of ABC superfamily n=1 Tax=Kluyvera cryocrescens TaxID=580 RepID=A0A485A9Y2_KLUCR|nr:putrescine transporter subunit: membrane component of ABC superfamily [Kluyvera cryocrescens]